MIVTAVAGCPESDSPRGHRPSARGADSFFDRAGFPFEVATVLRAMEKRHYRVNRSDICYIKYLMESYEGIATVSTEDAGGGRIVILIAPGCEGTVDAVMDAIKKDTYFERIDGGPPTMG
jgi:hypothetical protein